MGEVEISSGGTSSLRRGDDTAPASVHAGRVETSEGPNVHSPAIGSGRVDLVGGFLGATFSFKGDDEFVSAGVP